MSSYMGSHGADGGGRDKDVGAMLLPQTSLNEASELLSSAHQGSQDFLHRSSSSGSYSGQGQSGYMSHSALTGLAAAAAHHARYASVGQGQGNSSSMSQGMTSPLQDQDRSMGGVGSSNTGPGGVSGQQSPGLSRNNSLETSDTGSGGAPLSISYMRQGDNYVCSLCGKIVASKAAITRHIQLTHEKKKPFECNICHRRFGYKNILLEHQNIHFGIKPYSCNLCDKRFAARSNLFQHRLLHMKPFHCEVCNKRFDRADQLQRHLKLHPTSNMLSCNLCQFQATNVEALNHHLRESHTLQTFNTRSRFGAQMEGDLRNQDLPTQVPLGGAGMNNSSPGTSASTLETEAMRKIDTICSQLANRSQGSPGVAFIKSEPTSPIISSPQGTFPLTSPSHSISSPPFSSGGDGTQNFSPNMAAGNYRGSSGQFGDSMHPSSSPAARDEGGMLSPREQNPYSGDSPTSSAGGTVTRPAAGQFLTPSRRAASVGSIPGIQSFSRQNRSSNPPVSPISLQPPPTDRVRSSADSTSNLSEFFSVLQGLIQRSQDIPELNVSISRPKTKQDVGTQHNAVNIQGDVPSLSDLLVYYESQGKLYRCNHCKILFEERGMYFLHKSLHGELSPWECSICHKVCADKNDFHLHFVNEQHQGHG